MLTGDALQAEASRFLANALVAADKPCVTPIRELARLRTQGMFWDMPIYLAAVGRPMDAAGGRCTGLKTANCCAPRHHGSP